LPPLRAPCISSMRSGLSQITLLSFLGARESPTDSARTNTRSSHSWNFCDGHLIFLYIAPLAFLYRDCSIDLALLGHMYVPVVLLAHLSHLFSRNMSSQTGRYARTPNSPFQPVYTLYRRASFHFTPFSPLVTRCSMAIPSIESENQNAHFSPLPATPLI
jgi:hypothetical protein